MIKYLDKEYKDINDLAVKLRVRPSMAAHLYHCNGGTCDDEKDLQINSSLFKTVKEDKMNLNTKEFKAPKETK